MPAGRLLYGRCLLIATGAILLVLGLLFAGCANPVAPSGGQKDKTPPGIDPKNSTPDLQTNFKANEIKLTFDEWVKLEDAFNQMVVSPPLNNKPDIKLKGKTITVKFNDTLRSNTTYSIYFGNAVKDITESNVAKELRLTFSTGPFIDSLETTGNVKNAFSGEYMKDVLVMLYENLDDSIVYKEKPSYVAKTDESGKFKISHIKIGTYKVFALEDKNYNYLFDLNDEKIAFIEEPIVINDTTDSEISLLISEEEQFFRIKKVDDKHYGKVRFAFNKSPENIQIIPMGASTDWTDCQEVVKDSIVYWYDSPSTDSIQLLINSSEKSIDTIKIYIPDRGSFLNKNTIVRIVNKQTSKRKSSKGKSGGLGKSNTTNELNEKFETAVSAGRTRQINPNNRLNVEVNFPIISIDKDRIQLLEDSMKIPVIAQYKINKTNNRGLDVQFDWKQGKSYALVFLSGALNCFYGLQNDSIVVNLKTLSEEDYGKIDGLISGLTEKNNYIIQLINSSDEVVISDQIGQVIEFKKLYEGIEPGNYKFRIIEDSNFNGQWNGGNYLKKQAPERVLIYPLQSVKPNWEIEGKVAFNKPPKSGKKKPSFGE